MPALSTLSCRTAARACTARRSVASFCYRLLQSTVSSWVYCPSNFASRRSGRRSCWFWVETNIFLYSAWCIRIFVIQKILLISKSAYRCLWMLKFFKRCGKIITKMLNGEISSIFFIEQNFSVWKKEFVAIRPIIY